MDVPTRTSSNNLPAAQNAFRTHVNHRTLSLSGGEESRRANASGPRTERTLRREHSDGEVYGTSPDAGMRPSGFRNSLYPFVPSRDLGTQQEGTWDSGFELAVAGRREIAAQLLADRKKRREEHARRRSASNLSSRNVEAPRVNPSNPNGNYPVLATSGVSASAGYAFSPGDLNRPLPRRPSEPYPSDRRSREIALPQWQPDAEVNRCPICHTTFGLFYRKHHCRKCGRVVCANCSPHRITIPRQFIVHPPDDATPSPESAGNAEHTVVSLTSEGETPRVSTENIGRPRIADYRIDPALGGGQEVRLCNPCVPDPNPMPPPPYYFPRRSSNPFVLPDPMPSSHGRPSRFTEGISVNDPHSLLHRNFSSHAEYRSDGGQIVDASTRLQSLATGPPEASSVSNGRNVHQSRPAFSAVNLPTAYGSAPDPSAQERFIDGLGQRRRSGHHPHHRQHASLGGPAPSHSRLSWSQDLQAPSPRPVLPPQLREEDECPICHGALPPKGADGSETAREVHVSTCIETHFSNSTPRSNQPHQSAATGAAVAATAATPQQASSARNNRNTESSSHDRATSAFFQQRRRITGMVVYNATEKDCIGEDGRDAECVICFEEFSVGDEMGRLECLCKFHRVLLFLLNDVKVWKQC